MKKLLFLLLAAFAILTTADAANAQNLTRKSFNRLIINGQKFSFKDANRFIDSPETVARLQKGLRMEKAAIGLGIGGTGVFAGGMAMWIGGSLGTGLPAIMSAFGGGVIDDNTRARMRRSAQIANIGFGMTITGSAMVLTSIILGSYGHVQIKKTLRSYNSNGIAQHRRNETGATLGFAVAPGGLGVQLTF